MKFKMPLPLWTIIFPIVAWVLYAFKDSSQDVWFQFFLAAVLIGSVLAAVHHAEVVAHRVGEPFGTLVLAVAITIIEVALIVSLMISGGPEAAILARDTVFAAVMIILNAMVGLCLLVGGAKFGEQTFGLQGVSASLTTLTAIAILTLVLPNYTVSSPGPVYTDSQLIFVGIITLILYLSFVMVQTIRHRDYFLPSDADRDEDLHADPPSVKVALLSAGLLLVCLGAVVLLGKALAPAIEQAVFAMGAPQSLVGIIIAMVVLMPEGLAALRAARNNRLQTSLNLSLGSALASIGLTIPAVAIVSLYYGFDLTLGIDIKSTVLFILSLMVIILSLSTGRTTVLQGIVLLVLFFVYLFTTIIP
ncbi:ionic transporter y4hA [Flavihumibacter sediminis]|nr:ionic transporter y4hA [Flavihumibacter sediminis]